MYLYIFASIKIDELINNGDIMMRNVLIKIVFLITILCVLISCGKQEEDKIVLDPHAFRLSLLNVNSELANVEWKSSSIADKSNLVYDIYLNGELKESDIVDKFFTFTDLTEDTAYNIRVVAKSIYDTNKESFFKFKTTLAPVPSPLELNSSEILANQMTVGWTKTDSNDVLLYDVYLNGELIESNIDSEEYVFNSLAVETEYVVKIVGKNKYDKSTEISSRFTTIDYLSPEDFELSYSDVETNSAKILWTKSTSEKQMVSNIKYSIFVNNIEIVSDLTENTYILRNLKSATKYSILVKSINKYGKYNEKGITFKTKDENADVELPDFNIIIDKCEYNKVIYHIETVEGEVAIETFYVHKGNSLIAVLKDKESSTHANLEAETTYELSVTGKNTHNGASLTKKKSFTTLSIPTLSDFTVSAEEISQTSAVLKWTECRASDSSEVTYSIYYLNGVAVESNIRGLEFSLPNTHSPEREYRYRIVAECETAHLRKEKFVTFTTADYESASDFTVSYDNLTAYSVDIKWTESVFPSGEGIIYEIYRNGIASSRNAKMKWNFHDLAPDTSYVIKVVAKAAIPGNPNRVEKEIRFTTPSIIRPDISNIVKTIGKRTFSLSWDLDLKGASYLEARSSTVVFNGKDYNVGYSKTWSIEDLNSNTDYKLLIRFSYYDTEKYKTLTVEKEVSFKTNRYPEANDYNLDISLPFYHKAVLNINDFQTKNSTIYDDVSSMIVEVLFDDVSFYKGAYKDQYTFEGLNPDSDHKVKIIIKHSDGTLISEKIKSFTTSSNHNPVWSDELELKSVGFSYASFKNMFASDEEDGLSIARYEYYINGTKYTGGRAQGNTRHNGQIENGANSNKEDIVISHLEPNRSQTFSIKAFDNAGVSISTKTVHFTTSIDALENFHIDGIRLAGEEAICPVWIKMGKKESIKQIYIQYVLNGVAGDGTILNNRATAYSLLGNGSILIETDRGYSIVLPVDKFVGNINIEVSCRLKIEWKEPECLKMSTSNLLDIR